MEILIEKAELNVHSGWSRKSTVWPKRVGAPQPVQLGGLLSKMHILGPPVKITYNF